MITYLQIIRFIQKISIILSYKAVIIKLNMKIYGMIANLNSYRRLTEK